MRELLTGVFDAPRLRGTAASIGALAVALLVIDLGADALIGWDTLGVGRDKRQSYVRRELATAKAEALAQATRRGERFGVALGMSTTELGIDLRLLEAGDGIRWAKVTGENPSFVNLLEIARPLHAAGVAPVRTLVGVHYGMLAGSRRVGSTRAQLVKQVVGRTDHLNIFGELSRASQITWLGENRLRSVNAIERELGLLRERTLAAFSQRPEMIHPPVPDLFADTPAQTRPPIGPAAWARHMVVMEERGWMNPASYAVDGPQAQALTEIVSLLGQDPGLVIVLLPEHSALRAVIPTSAAQRAFADAIAAADVPAPPRVLDLREALPDDELVDEAHPSAIGREHLTLAIQTELARTPGSVQPTHR